jgi:hypothetical protein
MGNYELYKRLVVEFISGSSGTLLEMLEYVNRRLTVDLKFEDISKRTLQTTLQELKEEFPHEKKYNKYQFDGKDTEKAALEKYAIPDEDEKEFIPLLINLMGQYKYLPSVNKAIRILEREFNPNSRFTANDEIQLQVIGFKLNDNVNADDLYRKCSILITAIKEKKMIDIMYKRVNSPDLEENQKLIPLKMMHKDGLYYLYAGKFFAKSNKYELRNFKVHQIEKYMVSDEDYSKIDLTGLKRAMEFSETFSPGVFIVDHENYEVKYLYFKFRDWAYTYIKELTIHHSQKIEDGDPQKLVCIVRFKLAVIKNSGKDLSQNPELAFMMGRFREYAEFIDFDDETWSKEKLRELLGLS